MGIERQSPGDRKRGVGGVVDAGRQDGPAQIGGQSGIHPESGHVGVGRGQIDLGLVGRGVGNVDRAVGHDSRREARHRRARTHAEIAIHRGVPGARDRGAGQNGIRFSGAEEHESRAIRGRMRKRHRRLIENSAIRIIGVRPLTRRSRQRVGGHRHHVGSRRQPREQILAARVGRRRRQHVDAGVVVERHRHAGRALARIGKVVGIVVEKHRVADRTRGDDLRPRRQDHRGRPSQE